MLYNPPAVPAADLDITLSGYFGGEFGIYMSAKAAVHIGDVVLTAATVGTWVPNPAVTFPFSATDLQVVATTPILSSSNVVITLAGLDNSGTPVAMNGTATFAPPARATVATPNFERGIATDLVPATPTKMFTSITGIGTIVGGGPNQTYAVYALPLQTDYQFIVATKDFDFNTRSRQAKGIDAGMESDFWIKRGKTQPGELTIAAKLASFVDGMARFDGLKCTVMAVGIKDGQDTCDRLVFTQFVQTIKPRLPEGDGEAELPATGKFKELLMFYAS